MLDEVEMVLLAGSQGTESVVVVAGDDYVSSRDALRILQVKPQTLYVVYIPFATGKTLGLAEKPFGKAPWVMFPGTPKAHIMFTPGM